MSRDLKWLTVGLFALLAVLISVLRGVPWGWVPVVLLTLIYAFIMLWMRPRAFELRAESLVIEWPLHARTLALDGLMDVQILSREALRAQTGHAVRVGAGGLFGGFGYLWSTKLGWIQMYVSRTDESVLLTFRNRAPWLLSPDDAETFRNVLLGKSLT